MKWKRKQSLLYLKKSILRLIDENRLRLTKTAFKNAIRKFEISPKEILLYDPISFLNICKGLIFQKIRQERSKNKQGLKIRMSLSCVLEKLKHDTGEKERKEPHFSSKQEVIFQETNLEKTYERMTNKIVESFVKFQNEGSGWIFKGIKKLELFVSKYKVIGGSSYIPLSEYLRRKKAIVNIKNHDTKCFKWSVTRALHMKERNNVRVDKLLKQQAETLNWKGVNFPSSFHDVETFERNNKIGVILFGVKKTWNEEEEIVILRTPKEKYSTKVKLLLITDGWKKKIYCVVKNLSRLLSNQINNHKRKRYFCVSCLNSFQTKESLKTHQEYCLKNECVKTVLPDGKQIKDTLEFENYQRMHKVPFVIYADFEAYLKPVENEKTGEYQKHEPSGFCFIVKSFDDKFDTAKRYTKHSEEEDVTKIFVTELETTVKEIFEKFKDVKMKLTQKDKKDFKNATTCYACKETFEENEKVRDHCHFTGKYQGAACQRCNLKMKKPNFIPVFFHNLEGYDSHLFICNLGKTEGEIHCIPQTEEKYISFSKKYKSTTKKLKSDF